MIAESNIKNVLITGGTKGLGLVLAKLYTRYGATVHITHRWNSVEEVDLYNIFDSEGLKRPYIYCSNVGDDDDNLALIEQIAVSCDVIDVFISNVSFSQVINNFQQMKKNTLDLSIQYSAWPLVSITQFIHNIMGVYPKYIVGVSSNGPNICHPGYDYAGCAKAVLETLTHYMALRLREYGCHVNSIRPGFFKTDSAIATFGGTIIDELYENDSEIFVDVNEIAKVCLALTSGLMDAVNGQIITVDNGYEFISPLMHYISNK